MTDTPFIFLVACGSGFVTDSSGWIFTLESGKSYDLRQVLSSLPLVFLVKNHMQCRDSFMSLCLAGISIYCAKAY